MLGVASPGASSADFTLQLDDGAALAPLCTSFAVAADGASLSCTLAAHAPGFYTVRVGTATGSTAIGGTAGAVECAPGVAVSEVWLAVSILRR